MSAAPTHTAQPGRVSPAAPVLRPFVWLLLIALVPTLFAAWLHPKRPSLSATDGETVRAIALTDALRLTREEAVLWVDARGADAFANSHIPNAINLREDAWEELLPGFIEAWQPGQPVIVYCDGTRCEAARSVARRLIREFETDHVRYLEGGWEAWQRQPR